MIPVVARRFGVPEFETHFDQLTDRLVGLMNLETADDRAVALVGSAFLDMQLGSLIQRSLVVGTDCGLVLTDPRAPLSDFASRIEVAFGFGLIADHQKEDLHLIRRIRNDFAHHPDPDLSFETDRIRNLCQRIEGWKVAPTAEPSCAREQFAQSVLVNALFLWHQTDHSRAREAAQRQYEPGWRPPRR